MLYARIAILTCVIPSIASAGGSDLQVTEMFEGVSGEDLTSDWVELTNFGTSAYTFGTDGDLFYDDESMDPLEDEQVTGITSIDPGESVIVILTNDASEITDFQNAWGPGNVAGVQIGYLIGDDPAGLSQNGDGVFFFDGNTAGANVLAEGTFLGNNNTGIFGATWVYDPTNPSSDLTLQAVSGAFGAFEGAQAAGDFGQFPIVGSPGVVPSPSTAVLLGVAGLASSRRRRA